MATLCHRVARFCHQVATRCHFMAGSKPGSKLPRGGSLVPRSHCLSPPAALLDYLDGWLAAGGTRTQRKPRKLNRTLRALKLHEPPRNTRSEPFPGPGGSSSKRPESSPYLSSHHSETLPSMSYIPSAFASFLPTGWVAACWCGRCLPDQSLESTASGKPFERAKRKVAQHLVVETAEQRVG